MSFKPTAKKFPTSSVEIWNRQVTYLGKNSQISRGKASFLRLKYKDKMSSAVERPAERLQKRFVKRPDDKAMKQEIEKLKEEIKKLDLSNNEINAQLNKVVTKPEVAEKRKELQKQLKEVIEKQGSIKSERNAVLDQIKAVEATLKRKIGEIQAQTSKHNFKNVQEIDARVAYLDQLVDAGDLKLADERRFVKEMSALRKLRKDFGAIEKDQKQVDEQKTKIAELKKKLNSIQNKEVQKEFERIQKELDEINDANKGIVSKRNQLFTKRNEIKKAKDEKYGQIRKLRADFDAEFDKFRKLLAEEKKKQEEEHKKQQESEKKRKRKEHAEKELAEASVPAFTDEINSIHTLLSYFDPSYVKPQPKSPLAAASNGSSANSASSGRKIEMPEDVVVIKKEQESFFEGTKGKKASKSKKSKAKNFTVEPDIIVALGNLNIPLPTQADDVPKTIETLKETLSALEDKQEEQTKINIEKAKARIAKLEAEEASEADATSAPELTDA